MGAVNYGTSDYISMGLNVSGDFDECAAAGLVQYSPGWCTGYSDYKDTKTAINAAIKEMRREVQETPTHRQYNAA